MADNPHSLALVWAELEKWYGVYVDCLAIGYDIQSIHCAAIRQKAVNVLVKHSHLLTVEQGKMWCYDRFDMDFDVLQSHEAVVFKV